MRPRALVLLLVILLAACRSEDGVSRELWSPDADAAGHTAPTGHTVEWNRAIAERLPLDDDRDFQDARRGRVAGEERVVIPADDGEGMVWDTGQYDFLAGDPPPSVNPSLWRQARLNGIHGLFEVAEGIHQVRGYDLANMTLIDGESGWIVVDPLTCRETAQAALDLARRHLGDRPVSAVIFTHSHVDHFGGIGGVLSAEEARRRDVPIIAPAGFMEEATSENLLAGIVMARRSAFMYGMPLARSPRGHVGSGLGKEPARGRIGILPPTVVVDRTPQEMTIDGVDFVFQYAPETEAPAELTFYLPGARAFCAAEIASHTMHNLYTLRGARVRDALRWSAAIDRALELFGEAEVVFASHHWPTWGNGAVIDYLKAQRDTYRYIHDQAMRLAGSGFTPREIAEQIELPPSLRERFANRGYYGTLRHNAKAVYQRYFGWYDANPAHLDALPPAESAARYVEAMGGAQAVRRRAEEAFERGEYRWAATLLDHLVFAAPDDQAAREQLARTYDQLGYRAESGPWRDVYLTAAYELRHGAQAARVSLAKSIDLLLEAPVSRFLQAMATRLIGDEAAEHDGLKINFVFTDLEESYVLQIENAVLHARRGEPDDDAAATIRLTQPFLLRLAFREAGLRDLIFSDDFDVDGSRTSVLSFFSLLDPVDESFPIVTP